MATGMTHYLAQRAKVLVASHEHEYLPRCDDEADSSVVWLKKPLDEVEEVREELGSVESLAMIQLCWYQ